MSIRVSREINGTEQNVLNRSIHIWLVDFQQTMQSNQKEKEKVSFQQKGLEQLDKNEP